MQIFLLICLYITCCIDIDKFPQVFKHVDLISVHKKKGKKMIKLVIELSAYFQTLLQLTKKQNAIGCMIILIRHFSQANVDSLVKILFSSLLASNVRKL